MKFTVQKENIQNGLNAVIKAVATRAIQPVLSNVLIETVDDNLIRFCATDLDISIEVKVNATILEQGSITLPAKKLFEIISKLPNKTVSFELSTDNNLTKINCGNAKFDLLGISSSEFPLIVQPESDDFIEVEIETLLKAVKQSAFAVANYDGNNILSGIYFQLFENNLEMAATDGNRMSRVIKTVNNPENKEYKVVIPSRTLVEFSKILAGSTDETVKITIKSGQILFKLSDRGITSRLLEGQYPKYQQLIPSSYNIFAYAEKDSVIEALERTATMVNERTSIIKMNFSQNLLTLSADTPELGDSSDCLDIEYDAEDLVIAFNYKYVLDALKVIETDRVKIELGGSLSSALFKSDDQDSFLCLIMPVQIK